MSSTRRRMARPPRRRSATRADWVYRDDILDPAGGILDAGGTYTPWGSFTQLPGVANGQVHILYDSANYRGASIAVVNVVRPMGSWSRAEGNRARTRFVQGSYSITPSVWAVGSFYFWAARIIVAEQDTTGAVLLDPLYSMWNGPADNAFRPARWANGYDNKWEQFHVERFNDNNATKNFRVAVRARARLRPEQCLALYTETATGSSNVTVNMRLRTLVVDES